MRRMLMLVVLLPAAAGCMGTTLGGVGPTGRTVGIGRKVVMEKVEPNTLVAADRTHCFVSTERWKSARVGSYATCDWRNDG